MAGVARIAGGRAELRAMLLQVGDLSRCLQADLVTASTTLLTFDHRHGLPMNGRHRLHCCPRQGMLSFLVLLDLRSMAGRARIRSGDLDLGHIARRGVLVSVTTHTRDLGLAVLAESPVRNNVRRNFTVTIDALRR